ncbi:MAG: hypothetical protein NVS3B25_20820 [Hymenobacter sp.]
MSELQNPLFDEEKEFLERKKLEYERALRGDVDHLKVQSMVVGKVALVGAGLAGGIWLLTKAMGGRKRKRTADNGAGPEEADKDYDFGGEYYTAGNGKRYKSTIARKSAADSARVFLEHHDQAHEADDLGFGSAAAAPPQAADGAVGASPYNGTAEYEDDPFQDLPYDDSRRLPASHAFDDGATGPAVSPAGSRSRMVGSVLQAFLQSDTGKVLVAQVAAVALAVVTKKVSEFFPATKNSDLATSPGYATAETGHSPLASAAPSASSDAFNPSQSL